MQVDHYQVRLFRKRGSIESCYCRLRFTEASYFKISRVESFRDERTYFFVIVDYKCSVLHGKRAPNDMEIILWLARLPHLMKSMPIPLAVQPHELLFPRWDTFPAPVANPHKRLTPFSAACRTTGSYLRSAKGRFHSQSGNRQQFATLLPLPIAHPCSAVDNWF